MLTRRRAFPSLLFAVVVLVASCSGGNGKHSATTTRPTTAPATVRFEPLTGLATTAPSRAALSVEINHTNGPLTTGVDLADVVYEYVVEGGYTRLVAVFNSQVPDRIGPIRSVRPTEATIVWPLGGTFAFSGGAQYALNSINTAPVVRVQETNAGAAMLRDPHGLPPNNLYGQGNLLFATARRASAPQPLFAYRQPSTKVVGRSVSSFVVGFQAGFAILWTWDHQTGRWTRTAFGKPEKSTDGVQLGAKNVVVIFVTYKGGVGRFGAQAELIGHGNASVFTAGKLVQGRWFRTRNTQPAKLRDAQGQPIRLAPGQTWVEVIPTSYEVAFSPRRISGPVPTLRAVLVLK